MKKRTFIGLLTLFAALAFGLAFAACSDDSSSPEPNVMRVVGEINGRLTETIINKSGNFGKAASDIASGQFYVIRFIDNGEIISEGTIRYNPPYISFFPFGESQSAFQAFMDYGNNTMIVSNIPYEEGTATISGIVIDGAKPGDDGDAPTPAAPAPGITAAYSYDGVNGIIRITPKDASGAPTYTGQASNFNFTLGSLVLDSGALPLAAVETGAGSGVYDVTIDGAEIIAAGTLSIRFTVGGSGPVLTAAVNVNKILRIGGTLALTVDPATGVIGPDPSGVTMPSGVLIPRWTGPGIKGSGLITNGILYDYNYYLGQEITCTFAMDGVEGSVTATIIVCKVTVDSRVHLWSTSGKGKASITPSPTYAKPGSNVTIDLDFESSPVYVNLVTGNGANTWYTNIGSAAGVTSFPFPVSLVYNGSGFIEVTATWMDE